MGKVLSSSLIRKYPVAVRALVAIGIILLAIASCNALVATKPEKPLQPSREQVWTVEQAVIHFENAYPHKSAFGHVRAARKSGLSFNISGEVVGIADHFKNGAFVRKGDELARLETDLRVLDRDEIKVRLAASETNTAELAKQLELREAQYVRMQSMNAASIASQSSLDEVSLALSIARNALEQSRSSRAQLTLALKRAEKNLADAVLRAPYDGILSKVTIGLGVVLTTGAPVAEFTDINSLEASFVVPSEIFADQARLIGTPISVIWKAGGKNIKTQEAIIKRAEGNVDTVDGGGRLYASMPPAVGDLPPIPEGAFVEVSYSSGLLENVAKVPEAALNSDDGAVYVITDGRAERRSIQVIQKSDGAAFIRGDIANGEQIVATRLPGLGEGMRVSSVTP